MGKSKSKSPEVKSGKTLPAIPTEPKSEVARLRLLIEQEYQAAEHLRSGLAMIARHAFITARMENIGRYHEQLVPLVGEDEATRLLCETFSRPVSR